LRRASPAPDHCVESAGRGAVRQQGPDALVKRGVGEVGHGDLLLILQPEFVILLVRAARGRLEPAGRQGDHR